MIHHDYSEYHRAKADEQARAPRPTAPARPIALAEQAQLWSPEPCTLERLAGVSASYCVEVRHYAHQSIAQITRGPVVLEEWTVLGRGFVAAHGFVPVGSSTFDDPSYTVREWAVVRAKEMGIYK